MRLGRWPRGEDPSDDQLALAFYKDGKEIAQYSTLDIVKLSGGDLKAVPRSVSHYSVIQDEKGFREQDKYKRVFDIVAYNGALISFDIQSGQVEPPVEKKK